MAENLNLKTIDTVDTRPFKKLVMTIGELPTSFVESMTYYELLAWFVNYLETVIIPTVNNNAEAVQELQDLFVELKNFVDEYLDNLDIQEEVDKKLDEMVEDGTFDRIINQEIFGELNNKINSVEQEISDIQNNMSEGITVLLGDSYGIASPSTWCSWANKLINKTGWTLNQNVFNFCTGNSGLGTESNNYRNNLINAESVITDKTKVKRFIICGGYNDNPISKANLNSALEDLVSYINQHYVNAKIFIGMCGNHKGFNAFGLRSNLISNVLPAYQNISNLGGFYLNNIECVMHRYDFFSSDNVHPNEAGAEEIATAIFNNIYRGFYSPEYNQANSLFDGASNLYLNVRQVGNLLNIGITGVLYPDFNITAGGNTVNLPNITLPSNFPYIRFINETYSPIKVKLYTNNPSNEHYVLEGTFRIGGDGQLMFHFVAPDTLVGKSVKYFQFFNGYRDMIPIINV